MSKSLSNHSNNNKMNYKLAINTTTPTNHPSISSERFNIGEMKKGWVLLTKNGMYDTLTETEREIIEANEFKSRANEQMDEVVYRYLSRKRKELELEGYDEDEIDNIIENIIQPNLDVDEDYLTDEEDYCSNSDDDGYY